MSELSEVVLKMNRRGTRSGPCGTPPMRWHDLDDDSDILTEKEIVEMTASRGEPAVSVKSEPGRQYKANKDD